MSELLEHQFTEAMKGIYEQALKLPTPYHAPRFMQMVCKHGGKETARRLLATGDEYQSGLEALYHRGAMEISVEWLVLSHPWRSLFEPDDTECLEVAKHRLTAFHCTPPTAD